MLEFTLDGQELARTDFTKVIADSQNYLYAKFNLPEEHSGTATAYFSIVKNGSIYGTQSTVVGGQCMVPNDCIKPGILYVGLTVQDGDKLIPTNVVKVSVLSSVIGSGTLPDLPDTEPNQYLEFIRMYNEIMAGGGGSGGAGKSAYEIAVLNGFVGTEIQWLASLVGAKGEQGIQGATGQQGIQGPKGDTGPAGAQGPKGDTGAQGIQGVKGDKGDTGAQGPKGDTGAQGIPGANGTTPQEGIDYFTPAEIAQMKTEIEASMNAFITVSAVSNIYTIDFANKTSINVAMNTVDTIAKSIAVTNVPTRAEMYLEFTYTNAAAITWFLAASDWQSGAAPTLVASKTYRMAFFTNNGGSKWFGCNAGGA